MASLRYKEENPMYYDLKQSLNDINFDEGSFAIIQKIKIEDFYAAAKVFKVNQSPQIIQRVAKKFFALNHENIVKLLRFYTGPSNILHRSALIFEYCALDADGNEVHNLNELLNHFNENKIFDLKQRIDFVHQCSKGLNYLHGQGIIHKDFKPSNILVTGSLTNIQLKVADFDEMVAIKNNILSVYSNYRPKGMTLCYVAPEIIKRVSKEVSFKTDVYAWSLTSYEIMNDKCQAWSSIIDTMNDYLLVEALKQGERPVIDNIAKLYENVTKEHPIFKLISRGWDEDPESRPTSEQICTEIAIIVEHLGLMPSVNNDINEYIKYPQQAESLNPKNIAEDKSWPNVVYAMGDGGTRDPDISVLQNPMRNLNLDKTADEKMKRDKQKADEARKAIEEAFKTNNTDLLKCRKEILSSSLQELSKGNSQLFDILNGGNDFNILNKICKKLNLSDGDRASLNLAKAGGGNPAKEWLEDLKANHGCTSIEDFKNALKSSNVTILPFLNEISFVSMLNYSSIDKISNLLNPHDAWINIAEHFGYTSIQIEKLKRVQMRPNNYNPARTLFQIVYQRDPDLTVEKFMGILHEKKLNGAFNQMAKQVKDWAEVKVSKEISQVFYAA